MRRALFAAAAVIALTAPAYAQVTIKTEPANPGEPSGSTVSTVIIAPTAPPAPQAETPPPPPGPTMVWEPGHWKWDREHQSYNWVPGNYAEPPRPHAAFVPGHWSQRPDGWVWIEGHWN